MELSLYILAAAIVLAAGIFALAAPSGPAGRRRPTRASIR